ncbi:MAG: hypothetical protein ACK56J_09120, partial [Planctomycetota bacterium]
IEPIKIRHHTPQVLVRNSGIPLLVGLPPDSPDRVVTELDDPVACRPHSLNAERRRLNRT